MKALAISLVFLATASTATVRASELDPTIPAIPNGLIVREDGQGHREVFKADTAEPIKSADTASVAATTFVQAKNKISDLRPASELDRTTSNEAWYYWYNYNYYYSYYYYGYYYYYQPCYNWYNSGYNYYYYYRY